MKIKLSQTDIFTTLLCLTGIIPGIMFYGSLPEEIPVHFDINNQPDNYAAKWVIIFLFPVLTGILQLICCAFAFDREGDKIPGKVKTVCRLIIPVLTVLLEIVTIMFSLERLDNVGTIILIFLALMMMILGNYMPKCRRNSTFGIKIPSTLKSDRVWDKTHRFAGRLWIIAGIAVIILSSAEKLIPAIAVLFSAVLIPIAYSLAIADNTNRS